ncbi:MAG: hypothetical protein K6C96_07570, partial [Butyrivibrio sp.]|nr:hypothetical protein [Butyrivibrio sp.]
LLRKINERSLVANLEATHQEITNDDLTAMKTYSGLEKNSEQYKKGKQLHDLMVEQLLVSQENTDSLTSEYKSLVDEASDKRLQLETDANRKGMEKVSNDFWGTRKRAARKRIAELNAKKTLYDNAKQAEVNSADEYKMTLRSNRFKKSKQLNDACKSSGFFAWMAKKRFNGTEETRRMGLKTDGYTDAIKVGKGKEVSFNGHKGSKLKGYCFSPEVWNNKVVILYTGSGCPGSAEEGMGETIQNYLNSGFKVYQVDYRGYGDSGSAGSDGYLVEETFTEKHFYEDGMDIYKGVKDDSKVKPGNIIIHGYSMGASIASRVAATVALNNRKEETTNKTTTNNENYIGGIVMDSPMVSLKYAAGNGSVGSFGEWAEGKYSTEEHLTTLSDIQPEVPILFVSGTSMAKDHLSLEGSKIHKKFHFTNSSFSIKNNSAHADCHISSDLINNKFLSMNA